MLDEWWRYFDSVAKEGGGRMELNSRGDHQGQRRNKNESLKYSFELFFCYVIVDLFE